MVNTLILTVGLPRSGKSTWSQAQGHPIVNVDSIRFAVYGCDGITLLYEREDEVWDFAHKMVVALFKAGHHTVILDATNLSDSRRDEWKSPEWKTVLHVCPDGEEVCTARALALGQDHLVPVIKRMARMVRISAPYNRIADWEFV